MSYLVLARKYRPQTFADVIGQEHITPVLEKSLLDGKPRHAYLFCGSRGTGKTTCARILARELNAGSQAGLGELDLGVESSLNIIEIDGASNNGVDDVRTLRENVRLIPMSGGYKVYIIDEVHMLSESAFNALLKTLEEPPEHVVFIFATTDPAKLPATVLSRCQRFDFKRIPMEKIMAYLVRICGKESIQADEDALAAIARAAQGGMRDALGVLDQVSSAAGTGRVTRKLIEEMFGLIEAEQLSTFVGCLAAKDAPGAMRVLELVVEKGKDIKKFLAEMVEYFRHVMVLKVGGKDLEVLVELPKARKEAIHAHSSALTIAQIVRALDILIQAQDNARITEDPRLCLELAIVKIISDGPSGQLSILSPLQAAQESRLAAASRPASVTSRPATASHPVSAKPPLSTATAPFVAPPGGGSLTTMYPASVFPRNNKGVLVIAGQDAVADTNLAPINISLNDFRTKWNEITHTISQQKISVGTYLQAGFPCEIRDDKLMVGFPPESSFDRECLDTPENMGMVSDILSSVVGVRIRVGVMAVEASAARQESPAMDEAVEMFDGEIINEWHNDE